MRQQSLNVLHYTPLHFLVSVSSLGRGVYGHERVMIPAPTNVALMCGYYINQYLFGRAILIGPIRIVW